MSCFFFFRVSKAALLEVMNVYSKAVHSSVPCAQCAAADPQNTTLFYLVVDLMIFKTANREKQIHNDSQTKRENSNNNQRKPTARYALLSALRSSALQHAPASSCVIQVTQTQGRPSKSASRRPISASCIANKVGGAMQGGAIVSDPTHRSFVISMFIMAPEWQQGSSNVIIDQILCALVLDKRDLTCSRIHRAAIMKYRVRDRGRTLQKKILHKSPAKGIALQADT